MKKVTRRALRGHFHSPVVPAGHGNLRRIRDPSARRDEVRILRLRSQARFAQDDTALRDRVRHFRNPLLTFSQSDFNELSRKLPVLVDAKPFGSNYMIDIDERGGLPVIVQELL